MRSKKITPSPTEEELELERKNYTDMDRLFGDSWLLRRLLQLEEMPKTKATETEHSKLTTNLTHLHALVNGVWLMDIGGKEEFMYALFNMRKGLISEFKCTTTPELMLLDKITAAYWRTMIYEKYIHTILQTREKTFSYSQLMLNAIKELHKGIDQASRDFTANLTLLKGLKQPSLKINVKTDNAYIAQNQQVNNESKAKNEKGEIVDAG